MAQIRICDRCRKPITVWDELLQDYLDKTYSPHDICPDCDLSIVLRQSIARESSITGKSEKGIVKKMLEKYGVTEQSPDKPSSNACCLCGTPIPHGHRWCEFHNGGEGYFD